MEDLEDEEPRQHGYPGASSAHRKPIKVLISQHSIEECEEQVSGRSKSEDSMPEDVSESDDYGCGSFRNGLPTGN